MSEEIVNSKQRPNKSDRSDFINALKNDFVTSVKKVYINSLQKEVGFREITVKEQKTLSRIMIDNEQRKDVIYDAQCALINQVCLDNDFDIYECTEFDKIKLMLMLYQANMFKNEIKFTCTECQTPNVYKLDFKNVIEKLDNFDISDTDFSFENDSWKFDFKIGYPSVQRISNFYKIFVPRYKGMKKEEMESLNNMINMDYINMFIKEVKLFNKQTETTKTIETDMFSIAEVEEIFSMFPQDIMYVDDGVINYITKNYIAKINDSFEKHKCAACGAIQGEQIDNSVDSFF